jgi:hypothetical protein
VLPGLSNLSHPERLAAVIRGTDVRLVLGGHGRDEILCEVRAAALG